MRVATRALLIIKAMTLVLICNTKQTCQKHLKAQASKLEQQNNATKNNCKNNVKGFHYQEIEIRDTMFCFF